MWVYFLHEHRQRYEVGFFAPPHLLGGEEHGSWHMVKAFAEETDAAREVNYLNGGECVTVTRL